MTTFYCINDGVPMETTALLEAACHDRGIDYVEIDPRSFEFLPEHRVEPGNLLYRPAVSLLAQRCEQHLYQPGVATFYERDDDIYFTSVSSTLVHQRSGVPVPRTFHCTTGDRE